MGEHRKRQQKIVRTTDNKERGPGQQLHPVPAHGVPARPEAGQPQRRPDAHAIRALGPAAPAAHGVLLFSISRNLTHARSQPGEQGGGGAGLAVRGAELWQSHGEVAGTPGGP